MLPNADGFRCGAFKDCEYEMHVLHREAALALPSLKPVLEATTVQICYAMLSEECLYRVKAPALDPI